MTGAGKNRERLHTPDFESVRTDQGTIPWPGSTL